MKVEMNTPGSGTNAPRTARGMVRRFCTWKSGVWLALGIVALVLLVVYRRFLFSGLDLVAEATGGRWTALLSLVLGVLVLAALLAWLFLPFFILFSLRELRRTTAELERGTNLCARHLAQLAADLPEPKPPQAVEALTPAPVPKTTKSPE